MSELNDHIVTLGNLAEFLNGVKQLIAPVINSGLSLEPNKTKYSDLTSSNSYTPTVGTPTKEFDEYRLIIRALNTGITVNWPSSIKWENGAPAISNGHTYEIKMFARKVYMGSSYIFLASYKDWAAVT